MKKMILFFSLLLSMSVFGQNKEVLKDISKVTFYGVDFSKVKVYGAKETAAEFKIAFEGINNLFISEPRKYDVSKFLGKEVLNVHIDEVKSLIADMKNDEIFTNTEDYQIDQSTLAKMIKSLSIKSEKGTGFILVANELNKLRNKGYYDVVFFDTETKEIIDTWKAEGKARGFGLRNFWAASAYHLMKSIKL